VTTISLLSSKLEVLGPLQSQLLPSLTFLTFQTKYNLTSSLCLLVKHGLCLSSETHLFGIVTTLSLCEVGSFSSLVLSNLVHSVLTAFPSGTVCPSFFWYVHHFSAVLRFRYSLSTDSNSPFSFISLMTSSPPMSSPLTYSCGNVGQSE